jgi:hypothetical protein
VQGLTRATAVAFLSAGTLAYEILLVRAFAIEHFHHFAYMAIGVAMLGFGVSGTLLALVRNLPQERAVRWFRRSAMLTAVSLLASPALIHQVPLDATQIAVATEQLPRLAAVYVLAALPFALGALAVLLALTIEAQHPGRLYGASFLGSGLGGIVALRAGPRRPRDRRGPRRCGRLPRAVQTARWGSSRVRGDCLARRPDATVAVPDHTL